MKKKNIQNKVILTKFTTLYFLKWTRFFFQDLLNLDEPIIN